MDAARYETMCSIIVDHNRLRAIVHAFYDGLIEVNSCRQIKKKYKEEKAKQDDHDHDCHSLHILLAVAQKATNFERVEKVS